MNSATRTIGTISIVLSSFDSSVYLLEVTWLYFLKVVHLYHRIFSQSCENTKNSGDVIVPQGTDDNSNPFVLVSVAPVALCSSRTCFILLHCRNAKANSSSPLLHQAKCLRLRRRMYYMHGKDKQRFPR